MSDFKRVQKKWQKRWEEAKLFEPEIDNNKPKFFLTFPYPYVNGYAHIGHSYTSTRVEAFARYKRMKGYNVLFPQGWHCTGSPIVAAAKRVKEKEEKQLKILKDMGISEKDFPKFEDPEHWVRVFAPEWEKDFRSLGFSIDWRRNFITTSLNPYYDKFIRWQFSRLKEKGYVIRGKFPVVWCPKEQCPVSDHSRSEGEGETTQEFTLLKFKFKDEFIIAATLRPETVYGQTNLWVGPDNDYVKAKVNGETWIISGPCAEKLKEQEKDVEIVGKLKGKEMLGKYVKAPGIGREIIILPSHFCDPGKGTGIVTSVPSDAPDDYVGLEDLKKDRKECEKYGLLYEAVQRIEPIPIIDSSDLGDMAAVKVCKDMGIKSQHERDKLEEAKKLVYKKGFYEGVMNRNCGKYAGMKVIEAKDKVKEELLGSKEADKLYELTGKVVCRCLTPSIVKIVDNQWFINYGDKEWKRLAHKCVEGMRFYPEKVRQQFEYTIDWLHEWACTREEGLGTRLPWDERWLIESLSDSTIYMAYYTIAHLIKHVDYNKIDDSFFDYVFYGKGQKPDVDNIDNIRAEFIYWFPCDFRNSGKDLIQNHLTFFIFNHVALFPPEQWPKSVGANGWVTIDGQKMSKSLGNVIMLRNMAEEFGADASRITILNGGEGMDDPNWDTTFAKSIYSKLEQIEEMVKQHYTQGKDYEGRKVDEWFTSVLHRTIRDVTDCMDQTLFRSAIQKAYFDMTRHIKWYLKRVGDKPNKSLVKFALESQVLMLAPFTPHICEEIWSHMKKEGFISTSQWPNYAEKRIDERSEQMETLVGSVMSDISNVMKLAKIEKPKKVTLFVSDEWKYLFLAQFKKELNKTRNIGDLIKIFVKSDHGQDITKLIPQLVNNPNRIPQMILNQTEEFETLEENKEFFNSEFGMDFEIIVAEKSESPKARNAMPGKPAILLE